MILRIERHNHPDHARYIDAPGWYTVFYSGGKHLFFYAEEGSAFSGIDFFYADWLSLIEEQR